MFENLMNLEFWYRFFSSFFSFVFVISIAIFIHELGHFLFAKKFGVKVFSFSIGFPPTIWKRTYGETEYRLGAVPLGGYVKMSGEDPAEERTGAQNEFSAKPVWQRAMIIVAGPFFNIVLGFVLAVGLYLAGIETTGFLPKVGYIADESPASVLRVGDVIEKVDGTPVSSWFEIEDVERASEGRPVALSILRDTARMEIAVTPKRLELHESADLISRIQFAVDDKLVGSGSFEIVPWVDPVVGELKEDGPAKKAGLAKGDLIVSIMDSPIVQWIDITRTIRKVVVPPAQFVYKERWWRDFAPEFSTPALRIFWPDTVMIRDTPAAMRVVLLRGGETLNVEIIPTISFSQRADGAIDTFAAIGISASLRPHPQGVLQSFSSATFMSLRMGKMIIVTLHKLITKQLSAKLLAGPLGIAQGSGTSFREGGMKQLVYFLVLISINLGVVNLIPFPLLDGGWLFIFLFYEAVARKPMSQKVQERLMQGGIVLLLSLIVYITYNDLGRILGFQTVDEVLHTEQKK